MIEYAFYDPARKSPKTPRVAIQTGTAVKEGFVAVTVFNDPEIDVYQMATPLISIHRIVPLFETMPEVGNTPNTPFCVKINRKNK